MPGEHIYIENSSAAMLLAFEHYNLSRVVLLKKLNHAKAATLSSLKDIQIAVEAIQLNDDDVEYFEEIMSYSSLWDNAIELFEKSYVSNRALNKIEDLLSSMPQLIKKYYDALVKADSVLQQEMQKLISQRYRKALQLIKDVQSKPCLLSGLKPEEFDVRRRGATTGSKDTWMNTWGFKVHPPGYKEE